MSGSVRVLMDPAVLMRAVEKGGSKALAIHGARVMKTAVRLTNKPPRRMPLSEMAPADRAAYQSAQRRARKGKGKAPVRPFAPSRPGEPPRKITGTLSRNIRFVVERGPVVVIGPVRLSKPGLATEALEKGGRATGFVRRFVGKKIERVRRTFLIQPRPYMAVAHEKNLPKLLAGFGDCVR